MTDHTLEDNEIPGGDTLVKLAAVGGGLWVLSNAAFGDPRVKFLKDREKDIRDDMRAELENPDSFTDAELQTKIEHYKNVVQTLQSDVSEGIDVSQYESQLEGEDLETKALTWKSLAHRMTLEALSNRMDKSQFSRFLDDVVPDWALNLTEIAVASAGAAAFIVVIKKLLDRGRGGGGMGPLYDFTNWVREGLVGSPNIIEDIESDPAPIETPESVPTGGPSGFPQVLGSPRAAAQAVGLGLAIVAKTVYHLPFGPSDVVEVGESAVSFIVEATSITETTVRESPEVVVLMAIAIAAGAALAVADGPAPIGDAAGWVLIAGMASALGVSINRSKLESVMHEVANDVAATEQTF